MYIEHPDQNKRRSQDVSPLPARERKIDDFIFGKKEKKKEEPEEELLEAPHDMLLPEHSADVLAHWQAPEFEVYERDRKWYIYVSIILLAIISWAIYTDSPVMAITFILIGVVGYIHIHREPRTMDFMITRDGVVAGREIFDFDNIESFWIFYEPHIKTLSLKTTAYFMPFVHIPIHEENPSHLRKIILELVPEAKQEEGLTQIMERLLGV